VATTAEMTAEAALAETQAGTRAEIGTEVATGAVTEDVTDRVTETGAQSIPSQPSIISSLPRGKRWEKNNCVFVQSP
jgi:hypothetical protein